MPSCSQLCTDINAIGWEGKYTAAHFLTSIFKMTDGKKKKLRIHYFKSFVI